MAHKLFYTKQGNKYFKLRIKNWIDQGRNQNLISILRNTNPQKLVDSNRVSLLHIAATFSNDVIIQFLIELGCEIDIKNSYGQTPLMISVARSDNDKGTQLLLEADADVFITDQSGKYPLQIFFRKHLFYTENMKMIFNKIKRLYTYEEIVEKFIQSDCHLLHVVVLGDVEMTIKFLDKRAVNEISIVQECFQRAIETNDMKNVCALLYCGEEYIKRRYAFFQAFDIVLWKWVDSECLDQNPFETIISSFVKVVTKFQFLDYDTIHLVENLVANLNKKALQRLLQSDITSYVQTEFGCNLLLHVFSNHDTEVIQWIQKQVIDLDSSSTWAQTALHLSVKFISVNENVKYLLKKGMNPNVRDQKGYTPIFYILFNLDHEHNEKRVRLLLLYGADILTCENTGTTAIEHLLFSNENLKFFSEFYQSYLAHFAMLEAYNTPINFSVKKYLNVFKLYNCYKNYFEQLDKLKTIKFCGKLTLFDVLMANTEEVSRQVNWNHYEKIVEATKSQEYHEYYSSVLRKQVIKAVLLKKLRIEAIILIGESIPELKTYFLVLNKIVNYLNDELFHIFKDYLPRYKQELIKQ